MIRNEDIHNIVLHQIRDASPLSLVEIKPSILSNSPQRSLCMDGSILVWLTHVSRYEGKNGISVDVSHGKVLIDASIDTSVIVNDVIKGTKVYYLNDRIGIGRRPLHSYKIDVAVPENQSFTAFHIGDGKRGFSMGNGTSNGFVPEIIGIGSGENDAGLYLIGRAGNDSPSNVPLVIIDARNQHLQEVTNRPLFGVTNSKYNEYEFLIDNMGRVGIGKMPKIYKLEVNGNIQASDMILDSSVSLNDLVRVVLDQKKYIDELNERLIRLENN